MSVDNKGLNDTVSLVVNNYEGPYKAVQAIIDRVTWWDDDDATWNDVPRAARDYRAVVESLDPNEDGLRDLQGIDLDDVDFEELIREELRQRNRDAGRDYEAGL